MADSNIPFDQRDGFIWIDGETVEWKDAKIHVLSHGLHYGSGVFEGERMYNGKIFKCREHSERLHNSAKIMDMEIPLSIEDLDKIKHEVCEKNGLKEAYVRPIAWRGGEQMGVSAQSTKTHLAIAAWDWGTYFDAGKRDKGISLKTSKWRRPPAECAPIKSKSTGLYVIATLSKHSVEREGYDDALFLDHRGYVSEATGANLFAIKDGTLITPTPDNFLNGITRQTVIKLAEEHDIPVEVRHIMPEELGSFEEIFVTGTAAEVTAVGKIDEHSYTVGPITRKLREAYETLVRN
ncbi:MAG: branched-chain amino acid aminotransferase [Alphaproteobacteria bacterium]|nr:branched-chain amino acid aminotransferase [Alphaproteobacteria bacterium]